jgi:hypothetical protein
VIFQSTNGRHLFQTQTLASHGCHPVKRQQRHGIEIGFNPSLARNQGLAQAPPIAGQSGLHFPQAAPCGLCGRLLLARLPLALPDAQISKQLLETKNRPEQETRP